MANIKISELDAVASLDGTELIEVVQGGTNKKATIADVLPYKVYTALLSQDGTDAPIETMVLQDTIGGTPIFHYDGVGSFSIENTAAFTENKTICFATGSRAFGNILVVAERGDSDFVVIYAYDNTFTPLNGCLIQIEIRVHP